MDPIQYIQDWISFTVNGGGGRCTVHATETTGNNYVVRNSNDFWPFTLIPIFFIYQEFFVAKISTLVILLSS